MDEIILLGKINKLTTKINTTQADVSTANYSELLTQNSNLFSLGVGKNASNADIDVSAKVVNGNINYSIEGSTSLTTFKSVGEDVGGAGVHKIDLLSRGKNRFNKSTVTSGYSIDSTTGLNTANANYGAGDYIPVLPSISYILSGQGGSFSVAFYDSSKVFISGLASTTSFTTPANTAYLRFTILTVNLATTQMEMATVSTVFEEYTEDKISIKLIKPLKKAGTITDKLSNTGVITRNIGDVVTLDGSLSWGYATLAPGLKVAIISSYITSLGGVGNAGTSTKVGELVKYDGIILSWATSNSSTNNFNFSTGNLYISISNVDSGFVDGVNPSANEIKSYFYGWKMCGIGGVVWDGVATKYWKKITDGTGITSTLPTATYAGYTPYRMLYQLATPTTETLNVDTAKPNEPTGSLPLLGFAGGSLVITSGITPTFKCTVPLNFKALGLDNMADIKAVKAYVLNLDLFATASVLSLADLQLRMKAINLLTTETTTDLKAKINEILNIWKV